MERGDLPPHGRPATEKASPMRSAALPSPTSRPRFVLTCGVSTVLAVLLLVSGGRYAPLPRLGCDRLPSVMAGALAVGSAVVAPLRQASKQRQRHAFASLHTAATALSARPRLPHPPVFFAALPPQRPDLPVSRHLRGMLPLPLAPPCAFRALL